MSRRCPTRGCDETPAPSQILKNWLFCAGCSTFVVSSEKEEEVAPPVEPEQKKKPKFKERHGPVVAVPVEKERPQPKEATAERSATAKAVAPAKKSKKKITSCVEHPKYTATRRPRTDCFRCWAFYETRWPERVGKS